MKPRHVLALACLLPMLVPVAAADLPWDEARDAHWAGEQTLLIMRNATLAYLGGVLSATNGTYTNASDAAKDAAPPVAPATCGIAIPHSCAAGRLVDRTVESYVENATASGDEARHVTVIFLVNVTHHGTDAAVSAYRSAGDLLP